MVPLKSLCVFFIMFTCFQVKLFSKQTAPIEVHNANNESTKQLLHTIDESLSKLTQRFPDNITHEEFDAIIHDSFKKFYDYIITINPKSQLDAVVLYLQYCELIFKNGETSKYLLLKDNETKEALFFEFLITWENMIDDALAPMTESLYSVFMNTSQKA